MIKPIIKKGTALSKKEIEEMYQLHFKYRLDPSPEAAYHHIVERHVQAMDVTFYLYKLEGRIVAYHGMTWFERLTPFSKKPLPIFHINVSFKDPTADQHIKNYGKSSNMHLLRQHLGYFWFLKRFVMTFNTVNPKVIERLSHVLTICYPNGKRPPAPVAAFANAHLKEDLKIDANKISPALFIKEESQPWLDISKDWETAYKSASPSLNQFFVEQGIFEEQEGKQHLKVDNFAVFIGYYNPWKLLKRGILKHMRL